jgi:hypothetical protein
MDGEHRRDAMLIMENARRIGFAVAEITEAMGFLEDCRKSDARYWAMKALIRARDMLTSGSVT